VAGSDGDLPPGETHAMTVSTPAVEHVCHRSGRPVDANCVCP